MRLYLSGMYAKRDIFKEYAKKLEDLGITVTSRWLTEDKPLNTKIGDDTEEFYRETADIDLEDIDSADGILFFAEDPHVGIPRGGRHVEFGYALAKGRIMYTIGPKENIFHFLPRVWNFKTLEEFYSTVEASFGQVAGR
jgi:hypothetical protein